jgi:hypothetical protein
VDKTGFSADGPDTDTTASMYRPDTAQAMQSSVAAHLLNAANVRCDYAQTGERRTGGNGVGGADVTSEPSARTWRATAAPVGDAGVAPTATPNAENLCR